MPAVARTLRERFGLEARLHDPHLAVARGAALFALISGLKVRLPEDGDPAAVQQAADETGLPVAQIERLRHTTVATVVPRAFGIKVVDHKDPLYEIDPSRARSLISHLLTANTRLPADSGPQVFRTVAKNQRAVQLEVWEQAGAVASDKPEHNTHIGEGRLEELPAGPAGTPFEVVFHMTEMGLLRVHAREETSGSEVRFEIQIGRLDEAEVMRATDVVARYEVNG
jgi:molecular chaperone DnaK